MNKSYLIAGGASVASLAVGAVGGYFLAKRKFDILLDERINVEVEATKKHYSVLLMQARDKPASPADIPAAAAAEDDGDVDEPEEITEADQEVIAKGRQTLAQASTALTNYQGYADKPSLDEVVKSNIFTTAASPKKSLPPRDPTTGHFLPKPAAQSNAEQTPYLITHKDFLLNDGEYEQVNYKYFVNDKTLIDYDNESVEIGRVGEVNLTLFPQVPKDEPSIICVRNEWLQTDFEIQLVHESLTEYMGFGDGEEDPDEDEDPDFADLDVDTQSRIIENARHQN